jgi:hypothetical protein
VSKPIGVAPDARWPVVWTRLLIVASITVLVGRGLLPCGWKALTGFSCPTCGFTRASFALLRMDVRHAFELHPMVFLGLPLVVFVGGAWVVEPLTGRPPRLSLAHVVVLGAMTLALWVVRLAGGLGGLPP